MTMTLSRIIAFLKLRCYVLWTHWRFLFRNRYKDQRHDLSAPLIISLTSYPKRFGSLHLTIKTLLSQTVQADMVVLWVAESDKSQLPKKVLALQSHGLTIRSTVDTRSYKKIIPTLVDYPNSFVVTVDDDLYYPNFLLDILLESYRDHPDCVIANRTHIITYDEVGKIRPYSDWIWLAFDNKKPDSNFLTGVGGVLYPPGCFHPDVILSELYLKLAPTADDVWLYWMVRLNKRHVINTGCHIQDITWPGSQSFALWRENITGSEDSGNDSQIRNMASYYVDFNEHMEDDGVVKAFSNLNTGEYRDVS